MMTPEQMENAIQFLVESQSKFFTDIESLKERQRELTESQQRTDAQIQALAGRVDDVVTAIDAMRLEMREAMENLIVGNEVTRDLAQQIGKLAIQTAQRVTKLEEQNGKA